MEDYQKDYLDPIAESRTGYEESEVDGLIKWAVGLPDDLQSMGGTFKSRGASPSKISSKAP